MNLVPIYSFQVISLLQLQGMDEVKDVNDEIYIKAVSDSLRADRTKEKRIIDAAERLEQLGHPQNMISTQIRHEADRLGCTGRYLRYVSEVLSEKNPLWIDKHYSHTRSGDGPTENLENLTQKIQPEKFDDLRTATTDTIPEIAKYDLTDMQFSKLSPAEQQQYHDVRKKYFSQQKAVINHQATNYDTKAEERGVMSQEQANKKSTIIPPKALWGESDTYRYIHAVAEEYDTIAKYLRDIAKQVYVFKLEPKLDKEALKLFQSYHDQRMIPLWEISLTGAEEITSILENVQDEKNRDTALGWMVKGMHKHWDYGNHGTGEVDYVQTGEFIFRLSNNQKEIDKAIAEGKTAPKFEHVVIKVPVKRETTREQIGDKTTVRILDKDNQLQIHCPNHFDIECTKCGNQSTFHRNVILDELEKDPQTGNVVFDVEGNPVHKIEKVKWDKNCGLDFNKPIIGDAERDVFAGDLFYKAADFLRANKLSKAIETISDNVIYVRHQSAEQFFEREMKRRGKEVKAPKNLKVITEKPEKIKTVDLEKMSNARAEIGYNIWWGRAHRTADKSEHFSIQS